MRKTNFENPKHLKAFRLREKLIAALNYWCAASGKSRTRIVEEAVVFYIRNDLIKRYPEKIPQMQG